jgi:hypothetical protein
MLRKSDLEKEVNRLRQENDAQRLVLHDLLVAPNTITWLSRKVGAQEIRVGLARMHDASEGIAIVVCGHLVRVWYLRDWLDAVAGTGGTDAANALCSLALEARVLHDAVKAEV